MGPFIYYVITFLGFLDPPPPYVSMFLVLRISKNLHSSLKLGANVESSEKLIIRVDFLLVS